MNLCPWRYINKLPSVGTQNRNIACIKRYFDNMVAFYELVHNQILLRAYYWCTVAKSSTEYAGQNLGTVCCKCDYNHNISFVLFIFPTNRVLMPRIQWYPLRNAKVRLHDFRPKYTGVGHVAGRQIFS